MKFIKICSINNQMQIALIKSTLEASNIPYYVANENMATLRPFLVEMDIMVQEDKVEEAKELIRDFYNKQKNNL